MARYTSIASLISDGRVHPGKNVDRQIAGNRRAAGSRDDQIFLLLTVRRSRHHRPGPVALANTNLLVCDALVDGSLISQP